MMTTGTVAINHLTKNLVAVSQTACYPLHYLTPSDRNSHVNEFDGQGKC